MNNAIFAARLWAVLGETPMRNRRSRRIVTCARCGQARRHEAHGLCSPCYNATRPPRTVARPTPADRVDPATRLPLPAMTRCGGCADVPRCDRVARADVGYCWRCQQARAQGVAA